MPKIEHTNLIVDNFSIAKKDLSRVYTHLLTHVHTDHLKGLHDRWNFGPIYCTPLTARLLRHKYPSLACIKQVEYRKPVVVKMSANLEVTLTFLDANHMTGSAMILIQTYIGTILYTGDLRFQRSLFQNYTELYPPQLLNQNFTNCSRHIDILYLDNTFLKKKFNFPPKHQALAMTIQHITDLLNLNIHTRVYLALDSIGKQEVAFAIAQHFNTYIVVEQQKYQQLKATEYDLERFTTNPDQGFIQIIRKDKLYHKLQKQPQSTGIVLSGWVNHPCYRYQKRVYVNIAITQCIPYSLHSNYNEIHQFVRSIGPTFIYPIVDTYPDQNKLYYAEKSYVSRNEMLFHDDQFQEETDNYNKDIQELRRLYTTSPTPEYSRIANNIQILKKIQEELVPKHINLSRDEKCEVPAAMQTGVRKKYKLSVNNRNQQQINRLRNQILLKKKLNEGEQILEVEDSQEHQSSSRKKQESVIELDEEQEQDQIPLEIEHAEEADPFNALIQEKQKENMTKYKFKMAPGSQRRDNNQPGPDNCRKSNEKGYNSERKMSRIQAWSKLGRQRKIQTQCINLEEQNSEQPQSKTKPRIKLPPLNSINLSEIQHIKIYKTSAGVQRYLKNNVKSLQVLKQFVSNASQQF